MTLPDTRPHPESSRLGVTPASRGLHALFAPRGVAVIGASRTAGKLGAVMAASLSPFGGPVALVNSRDSGNGFHGSVADAVREAGPIDLAVLCVPAAASVAALREAAAAGVASAVVCAAGFGEAGPEGAAHERALVAAASELEVRLLGPNTSGFIVPGRSLFASFVPGVSTLPAGSVGLVAASGGMNHALAFLLADSGHGVSLAVGLGNAVDVNAPEVLDHLADDAATTAVALHVESVSDGPRLLEAVGRLADRKPVVALVVGRSDVGEFAASHTGALATSWRTTRAVLRQAGAVLVDDERQLVDAVAALSTVRLAPHPDTGVGVVTAQAGPGLLLLDTLRAERVRVPPLSAASRERLAQLLPPVTYQANPVDTGRPSDTFGSVLATVAADEEIGVVAGYALAEGGAVDVPSAVAQASVPGCAPVLFAVGGHPPAVEAARHVLLEQGTPAPASPTGLATAVRALVEDARTAHRRSTGPGRGANVPLSGLPVRPTYDEAQAKDVLDALGILTEPRRACDTRDEAREAFAAMSGPVAVKLLDADVLHKTEVGGVHLGIRARGELDQALEALVASGARRFLVEQMAPPGVDLIVGVRRDPVFGPVALLGAGGTAAEVLADVSIRAVPVGVEEARSMPDELALRALLEGWRGGPSVDRADLVRVVQALGAFVLARPDVEEVEVNPLRVSARGLVALDAVIITSHTVATPVRSTR